MKYLSVRRVGILVLFVMLAFSGAVFVSGVTHAANWTGRAQKYGYFDNKFGESASPYPDGRGPVVDNNDYASDAIPASVNTKAELLSYLKDKYNNPGTYGHAAWDKTGISFIVNTMLGNDPSQASRTITAAMWSDLSDRLNAASLTMTVKTVSAGAYGNVNTYYQYGNNDVAWYSDSTESGKAMVLSSGGVTRYVLLYACANPLGNLGGLSEPAQWTIGLSTAVAVSDTTVPPLGGGQAIPGDKITWTHVIKNNGPDATDQNVAWRYNNSGNLTGTGPTWTFASNAASGKSTTMPSTYIVQDKDLGTRVCRNTWAQPKAWNDSGPTSSSPVCVDVVWRYGLTPHATFGGNLEKPIELGSTTATTVNMSVDNSGPTTSKSTIWTLSECKYGAGVGVGVYGATASPSGSDSPGNACTPIQRSPNSSTYTKGDGHQLPAQDGGAIPANTAAGSHICYVLSVSPASDSYAGWAHSIPACLSVTKSPKVQAWGADIRGGTIATRQNYEINGKYYGSWAEYGIFGIAGITNMGSNASLAGGAPSSPTTTALNALTFANTPNPGYFEPAPAGNTYYTTYSGLRTATTGSTSVGTTAYGNNTQAIIAVNGNLKITGNLTYTGSYASPGEIPRVIYVVSGNILIDPGVTQIDPWLIAEGTLYTCDTAQGMALQGLTVNDCNQKLTFNGPVNVNNAVLARTYGADGVNEGDAAEIFNLNPSNFLSSYAASASASNIQTVYEKELPPRW